MAQIRNLAYQTVDSTNGKFEMWSRIGFAAKGIVYILVGVLSLMAALGTGGETTGSKGAISQLGDDPFGHVALLAIGVGLLGYALWRIVSALKDTEGHGSSAKGLASRTGHFIAGLLYAGTAVYAVRMAVGDGDAGSSNNQQAQSWTAELLNEPFGVAIIVAIGIAILVAGIFQIRHGWKEKFRRHFRSLPPGHDWLITAGKWGYVSRGIVFAIMGGFVVIAALRHDPSQVRGMKGALDTLAAQPYGQVLLGVVAAGLACYGIYSAMSARYREV